MPRWSQLRLADVANMNFVPNLGSHKIEIIKLAFPKADEKLNWDGVAFMKMNNLRTIVINKGDFSDSPKHLSNSLKVLKWRGYPSQIFPFDFYPKEIAILWLPDSSISSLISFFQKQKASTIQEKFINFRVLNFSNCQHLKQIPDLSVAPHLEELSFCWCKNLTEVHKSVGLLNKLRMLDAKGCCKLRSFPDLMLPALQQLRVSSCSSLESFPEILGKMESLTKLELEYTPIKEFPPSIRYITRLERLELWHSKIVLLPSSIFLMKELKCLRIRNCDGLLLHSQEKVEEQISSVVFSNQQHFDFRNCNVSNEFLQRSVPWLVNVKELNLSSNSFTILPACIEGSGGDEEDDLRRNQQQQFEAQAMKRMILAFRVLMGPGTRLGTKFRFATSASRCWLQRGIGGARSSLRLLNWRRKGLQDNYGSRS
ncbi:hypothetical protein Ahy_B09g099064 [Arachis hypogaea]|uniref:Disease resistance protein RPS4B/Roq1-like leucine-rich repeats domain-containing protein n=1 Tax=Arachis hypogaea TaxID=3818 RepID=A0A444XTL5_ARAHY|nr:hypothetical protein Ahy_B09g099064 [Arachis hypogaea]